MRRLSLPLLPFAFLASLLGASPLAAQTMTITINPGGGTYYSSSYNAEVVYCDNAGTPFGLYGVELNGNDVTNSLSYSGSASGCSYGFTLTGTLTLSAGSNTIYAWGYDSQFSYTDATIFPTYSADKQVVSSIAIDYADKFRDVGRCIASCFASTASYSTPSYTSVDVERSATLLYRSDRAKPLGFVQLVVTDISSTPVEKYSLRLIKPEGGYEQFTNGATEIWFAGGSGTTTLAAQFDASGRSTGAYQYTAVIRSYWSSGPIAIDTSIAVRVMVDNGAASEFGAGWAIAGLQRLHVPSGYQTGALVTSGDGSLSVFETCGSSCQLTSPTGDFSTLTKNANGTYTRRYPDGIKYEFDGSGYLTSVTNRYGTQLTVSWSSNRVSTFTDPASGTITFSYDGSGKISAITTQGSRQSDFTVNGSGDLTYAEDPDNVANFTAYYSNTHRLDSLADRRGGKWSYSYALDGRVQHIDAPAITVSGSPTRPRTTLRGPVALTLDSIARGTQGGSGDPAVTRNLDARAAVTDPRSNTTYFALNRWGSPTQTDYPVGPSGYASYNAAGQVASTTAPSGHYVTYTWTGPNLTQTYDASAGTTINMTYESTYSRLTKIAGNTVPETLVYNDVSRTVTRTKGSQGSAVYTYNTYGQLTQVSDAGSHVTNYYPNGSGLRNADSVVAPNLKIRYTRDSYGRPTVVHDGTPDTISYDLLNRRLSVKQVNGVNAYTTSYTYDGLYLTAVTDAASQVYSYIRNALGWVEKEKRPGSDTLYTAYDAAGNVVSQTNRRSQTTSYAYDALNRVTSKSASGAPTINYYYGIGSGSFVAASNSEGVDTLFYNAADQLIRAATWRSSVWYQVEHAYTAHGWHRKTTMTSSQWAGSKADSMTYTGGGEPNTRGSWIAGMGWDIFGNESMPATTYLGASLEASQAYTSQHGVYGTEYNNSNISNRLGVHLTMGYGGKIGDRARAADDSVRRFTYDGVDRLIGVSASSMSVSCSEDPDLGFVCSGSYGSPTTENMTYDAVGNWTNTTTLSASGNRYTLIGTDSLFYDADGNLIRRSANPSQTFRFNAYGQMDSSNTSGTWATYHYDGFGRRVRKVVSGTTTRYLHDSENLAMELDGSGNPVVEYLYEGIDRPVAMRKGGTNYWVIQDGLAGSVRGVVRQSDNSIVTQIGYTPFGEVETGSYDSLGVSLRFAGREYDAETGLYYNRARYYHPQLRRFISEDPIGIEGGINLYVYAGNDPVNRSDPMGLCSIRRSTVTVGGLNGAPSTSTSEWDLTRDCFFFTDDYNGNWGGRVSELPTPPSNASDLGGSSSSAEPTIAEANVIGPVSRLAARYAPHAIRLALATRLAQQAFRPGSWLNRGQHWRVGFSKGEGGWVFRIAGEWLESSLARSLGVTNGHIDLVRLGGLHTPPPWYR